ncbi:MAG: twin-arginine translocation signal domain-containing protein [Nocardioidaceae bacterium]|nr:twin-arginine translocation signal domain-containing protein [Nocardioidaceae bacterium]
MGFFDGLERRDFLKLALAGGGVAALKDLAGPVLERAYAADPAGQGGLGDIEHFVFLMMENRSFDHYFGTMSGVRGFADARRAGTIKQYGYNRGTGRADPSSYLMPFRLNTTQGTSLDGECINDPTHNWAPQHHVWDRGRMDRWVPVHLAGEGTSNGPATMGYYTRADIPVHWALADAFTVCDHYFCSVMGPTDPNRLYWMSGTIDPEGRHGGPLLDTPTIVPRYKYGWRTMPENLQEAGVSWKVYTSKQVPIVSESVLSGMMESFKQTKDTKYLQDNGVAPTYPHDFDQDVASGRLPKVSWVIPPLLNCEHPALPPSFGAVTLLQVLNTLTAHPGVWEKTALIISYDENGGFFDHVPPPVPPKGEPGEWLAVDPLPKTAEGVVGPIGLGFRVPALVVSPYSRGGLVSSEVFDHTSQLRLLETRFGVEVPNLSKWRRRTTGDLTGAFDFARRPNSAKPRLEATTELGLLKTVGQCKATYDTITGTFAEPLHPGFPVPPNKMPVVETTPHRGRPSGLTGTTTSARVSAAGTADLGDIDLGEIGVQPPSRIAGVAKGMRGDRPLAGPERV